MTNMAPPNCDQSVGAQSCHALAPFTLTPISDPSTKAAARLIANWVQFIAKLPFLRMD
jgi:hypothetical protein